MICSWQSRQLDRDQSANVGSPICPNHAVKHSLSSALRQGQRKTLGMVVQQLETDDFNCRSGAGLQGRVKEAAGKAFGILGLVGPLMDSLVDSLGVDPAVLNS